MSPGPAPRASSPRSRSPRSWPWPASPPRSPGRPITHWTGQELADEVAKRGIVASISTSQVGRYFREAELQPHKSRYWLNTTEKDPERFEEQVEAVCDRYQAAPALGGAARTHTVCIDEMTGIQALERIAPDAADDARPDASGRVRVQAARDLDADRQLPCGDRGVDRPTLGPTRTEADFAGHIEQTVATDPDASWVFVVDNLNIHCSETLVQGVATACGIDARRWGKRGNAVCCGRGESPGVPVGPRPSHPLRVHAEAHVVAEPDRDRLRRDHAEGDPPGFVHLGGGPAQREKLVNFIAYFNRAFAKPFPLGHTHRPSGPDGSAGCVKRGNPGERGRYGSVPSLSSNYGSSGLGRLSLEILDESSDRAGILPRWPAGPRAGSPHPCPVR